MGEEAKLRTDYAGSITSDRIDDLVRLAGWVDRRRDHGGVIFFDLRDTSGLVQVVVDPAQLPDAGDLKMEFTVSVAGAVRARPIALTGLAAMAGAFFILDDPIFSGLAVSLIFGILVSTLLTLVVIPVVYYAYQYRRQEDGAGG